MVSKENFDKKELSLLSNVEILEYREIAYEKVQNLLREVKETLAPKVASLKHLLPTGSLTQGGKISKGENLKGLPYLVLDYPRYKQDKELILFRTMFWWGNYFSVTLHLQGEIASRAFANLSQVSFQSSTRFSVDKAWNHDVRSFKHDATSIRKITQKPLVFKIAETIPLANSNELPVFSLLCYETWIQLIALGK
jgi:hypothetical protein